MKFMRVLRIKRMGDLKNWNRIVLYILSVTSLITFVLACGSKKESKTIKARQARNLVDPGGTNSGLNNSGIAGSSIGKIILNQSQGAVSNLISNFLFFLNPDEIGIVNPQTGVTFSGSVNMNSGGGINTSNSLFQMEIQDSFSLLNGAEKILVGMNFSQIQINGSNVILTAQDDYGVVVFNGNLDNTQFIKSSNNGFFSGKVSYYNTGNSAQQSSVNSYVLLGDFTIQTCGFFVCQ